MVARSEPAPGRSPASRPRLGRLRSLGLPVLALALFGCGEIRVEPPTFWGCPPHCGSGAR